MKKRENSGQKQLRLTIKKIGINGEGIAYHQRKIVFVRGAIPREIVTCRIVKETPRYMVGEMIDLEKPSPHRVQNIQREFLESGAYQLVHVAYPEQLRYKREILLDSLQKYKALKSAEMLVKETLPSPNIYHYRNKNQFPVIRRNGRVLAGLYREGSHRLVSIRQCIALHETGNRVTEMTRASLERHGISLAENGKGKGIQYLSTRTSFSTGETQLVLVATDSQITGIEKVVADVCKMKEVVSIVLNIRNRNSHLVMGETNHILYGQSTITEKIGETIYELSANSFFQLNPLQTERLYQTILDLANIQSSDQVLDAFCGVGSIGLYLSPYCQQVTGMDIVPEAIADAQNNCRKNGYTNCHYEVADATTIIPIWKKEGKRFDLVVVDPPRTGLGEMADHLLQLDTPKIIYVSCNPSSLARDLTILQKRYTVQVLQPLDMFPHTPHVECVALLVKA